jgi:isoleucyl-tRNA synthetase
MRRWERLIAIRDEVNRALEAARQAKTIGTSLGAQVRLRASGETASLLAPCRDDLAMLFIVSQLELETVPGDGAALEVLVERAAGEKCARCWRTVPDVATSTGLCRRCTAALAGRTSVEVR